MTPIEQTEPVFVGTRLSVLHIGKMVALRDVTIAEVLEDYPYLTESDVRRARTYYCAQAH